MSGRRLVPNSRRGRAGRGGSGREFTPFAGQGFRLGVDPTTTAAAATEVEVRPRPKERAVACPPTPRSWEELPPARSSSSTGESSGAPRPTVNVEDLESVDLSSESDNDNREMLIDDPSEIPFVAQQLVAGIELDELGNFRPGLMSKREELEQLEQVRTVSAAWSMEIPELTDFVSEVTMVVSELEQVHGSLHTTIMQLKIGALYRKFAELRANTTSLRMPSSQETSSESENEAASSSQVRAPKRRRTTKSKAYALAAPRKTASTHQIATPAMNAMKKANMKAMKAAMVCKATDHYGE